MNVNNEIFTDHYQWGIAVMCTYLLIFRISEIAGARLKSNNPAIADLSDQNRPSKLAEKFSELYDNEWTDATEELKRAIKHKEKSEEELDIIIIRYLYNFTKVGFWSDI